MWLSPCCRVIDGVVPDIALLPHLSARRHKLPQIAELTRKRQMSCPYCAAGVIKGLLPDTLLPHLSERALKIRFKYHVLNACVHLNT